MTEQEHTKTMTREVVECLMRVVRDETATDSDRVAAGKAILARGLGAAPNVEIVEQTIKVAET